MLPTHERVPHRVHADQPHLNVGGGQTIILHTPGELIDLRREEHPTATFHAGQRRIPHTADLWTGDWRLARFQEGDSFRPSDELGYVTFGDDRWEVSEQIRLSEFGRIVRYLVADGQIVGANEPVIEVAIRRPTQREWADEHERACRAEARAAELDRVFREGLRATFREVLRRRREDRRLLRESRRGQRNR